MKYSDSRVSGAKISQKAGKLAALYHEDADLTVFTTIDGDDFHEAG